MNDWLTLIASGAAGALLGLVFFWGLWATVRRLVKARHPAVFVLGSLMIRFGFVLAGFVFLARYGGWEHLLAAAAGFMLSRLSLVRRVQSAPAGERSKT